MDFVTSVGQLNTLINNVRSNNTNLPYAFIVLKKDILQGNALKIRKDSIVKGDLALDVDLSDTLLKTAQQDMEIKRLFITINRNFDFLIFNF